MEARGYSRLAAVAAAHGYSITPAAIHRWVSRRLLPPTAITRSVGRGGFVSTPTDAVEGQLLALLEWRKVTKSTDALRVLLWMDGWTIPAADVLAAIQRSLPKRPPLTDRLRDEVSRIARNSAVKARRRAGAHGMDAESSAEGLEFFVLRALGDRSSASGPVAESVYRLLGLDRAQADAVGETPAWLPPTSPSAAPRLVDEARVQELPESAAAATTADLDRNRERVRFVVEVLGPAAEIAELYGGTNFAGMRGLQVLRPALAPFAAALVLHIERLGLGEQFDAFMLATDEGGLREAIATLPEVRAAIARHPQRGLIRRYGLRALANALGPT